MRGGDSRVGGTRLGVGCARGDEGCVCCLPWKGPEGCGGREKTSKDDSAIIGLRAATNHSRRRGIASPKPSGLFFFFQVETSLIIVSLTLVKQTAPCLRLAFWRSDFGETQVEGNHSDVIIVICTGDGDKKRED